MSTGLFYFQYVDGNTISTEVFQTAKTWKKNEKGEIIAVDLDLRELNEIQKEEHVIGLWLCKDGKNTPCTIPSCYLFLNTYLLKQSNTCVHSRVKNLIEFY